MSITTPPPPRQVGRPQEPHGNGENVTFPDRSYTNNKGDNNTAFLRGPRARLPRVKAVDTPHSESGRTGEGDKRVNTAHAIETISRTGCPTARYHSHRHRPVIP
jgi:hypothetical protein